MKNLITGATGFVGSHVAEKLKHDGQEVIALARESSDTSFIEELGIEIRYGDLADPASVYDAVTGIDRVFHVAAVTGEWVRRSICNEVNVEGTSNLMEASLENGVGRFFFVSSLAVMGFKNHYNTGVETDYPKAHDPYIDTKIEAEKLAWRFHEFGLPITVIRPGFMYGPRDRRFLKRILEKLRTGKFKFVGDGKNKLNLNYAGNFADAVVLASKTPHSIGQAYNVANDDKTLDMETFIFKVADLWQYDRPQDHIPLNVAKTATSVMETCARLMRKKEPPLLTKTRLKFLSLNLEFDISKAKEELGFENRIHIDEGLAITKQWIEETHAYDEPAEKKETQKKIRLPYTYRDGITVESEKYKRHVRNDIRQLKKNAGDSDTIIRLESILGEGASAGGNFEIAAFDTPDSQTLKYNKWKSRNVKHVLVYLNGLESHAGWFSRAATDLIAHSVAVYALDRRGSGLNTQNTGKYQDWINDVHQVIEIAKRENPRAKLHLVSICLGAVVATACAIDKSEEIDSLIFISPGINVKVDPTPADKVKIALDMLPAISFNIPSPIRNDNMFTDSPEALYFLHKDKLRTFSPRACDFFQIMKLKSHISRNLEKINVPTLVLLAQRDQIVDNIATKQTLRKFAAKPEIIEYAGSEHALLLGDSKDRMVADIIAFLKRLSPAGQPVKQQKEPVTIASSG
jgi:nucleoside-diphosphate-sugar epimerase/alpha-beta hydrolase superfamily lysophospholipase